MPSEGHSPSGVSDDATVGTVAWTCSPGDLDNDDGTESSAVVASGSQTHYLKGTNCPFTIPSGATIDGMLVSIMRRVSNAAGGMYPSVRDAALYITLGGGNWSANLADTGTDWPASELGADYGGPSTNLAPALSANEINDASFGVLLSISASGGALPVTAYVDRVTITIYYTSGGESYSAGTEWIQDAEPDWIFEQEHVGLGIVDDEYNAPPATDAVTLYVAEAAQYDDGEQQEAAQAYDALPGGIVDGMADAMLAMLSPPQHDELDEPIHIGNESLGAAWMSDGPTCDCAGIATVTSSGYGSAIVTSYGDAGESPQFGTAIITAGYGTAKLTHSCQC